MPRILVLADCDSELGDGLITLDADRGERASADQQQPLSLHERMPSAVLDAPALQERVSAIDAV
jgi:hypothetical protein